MSKFIQYRKPLNNAANTLKTLIRTLLLLPLPYIYFNDVKVNAFAEGNRNRETDVHIGLAWQCTAF